MSFYAKMLSEGRCIRCGGPALHFLGEQCCVHCRAILGKAHLAAEQELQRRAGTRPIAAEGRT